MEYTYAKKNVIYLKFKFQIKFSRLPSYHSNRGKHHNIYNAIQYNIALDGECEWTDVIMTAISKPTTYQKFCLNH